MKNIRCLRIFSLYVFPVLFFFLFTLSSTPSGALPSTGNMYDDYQDIYGAGGSVDMIEHDLLDAINRERTARGLNSLYDLAEIKQVCREHSLKMAAEQALSHTFPDYPCLSDRLKNAGLSCCKTGENIGYCKLSFIGQVHPGFMNSEVHRANILDPNFTHCSVGIVKENGVLFITQVFVKMNES